jgi:phosphate-selective porin OprO/OprP
MTHFSCARLAIYSLTLGVFALTPFAAKTLAAQSESERLEKLEKAVELLQQRNAELEREVSSFKKQKSSTTVLAPEKRSQFVPESKSYVEKTETTEEKKPVYVVPGASEIKLTLGGFIQGQYEIGDVSAYDGRFVERAGANKDRFRLRRARITVTGDFWEQFDFKAEGAFEQSDFGVTVRDANGTTLATSTTRTEFSGTDLFINWHKFPEFNIKIGQYKAPFGLEQLTPDTTLFVTERSEVTEALTPERQVGLMLWGKPFNDIFPEQKDFLTYSAGIFNGNGRNISVNDNNEYMYVGRVELRPFKGKIFNEDAWLKLGGDALTSRDDAGTVLTPVGNLRVNSDGSLTSFTAPSAAERDAYGVDATFHLGPFDLIGEYLSERFHSRTVNGVRPLFRGFRADGYYVQGSYFLIPKKLQLVAKYESFNPGQVANDDLSTITGGVNYYIHGDDIKLMADYLHTWSDFRESNPIRGRNEFDEVILRLQVMF